MFQMLKLFFMLTVKLTNANSTFVADATLKRPLAFLKCRVKNQFASLLLLGGSERMMCTQHAASQSSSSNLKGRILPGSDVSFINQGITLFPVSGGLFLIQKRRAPVFIIPPPSMKSPTPFLGGRSQKGESEFREALL